DSRHRRGEEALHDRLRCFEKAAGRIQLDDQTWRPLLFRLPNCARNVVRRCRSDCPVHFDQSHIPGVPSQARPKHQEARYSERIAAHGDSHSSLTWHQFQVCPLRSFSSSRSLSKYFPPPGGAGSTGLTTTPSWARFWRARNRTVILRIT